MATGLAEALGGTLVQAQSSVAAGYLQRCTLDSITQQGNEKTFATKFLGTLDFRREHWKKRVCVKTSTRS